MVWDPPPQPSGAEMSKGALHAGPREEEQHGGERPPEVHHEGVGGPGGPVREEEGGWGVGESE